MERQGSWNSCSMIIMLLLTIGLHIILDAEGHWKNPPGQGGAVVVVVVAVVVVSIFVVFSFISTRGLDEGASVVLVLSIALVELLAPFAEVASVEL